MEIACREANLDASGVLNQLHDPRFGSATDGCDWQQYVPDDIREAWGSLSEQSRLCLFIVATERSGECLELLY